MTEELATCRERAQLFGEESSPYTEGSPPDFLTVRPSDVHPSVVMVTGLLLCRAAAEPDSLEVSMTS